MEGKRQARSSHLNDKFISLIGHHNSHTWEGCVRHYRVHDWNRSTFHYSVIIIYWNWCLHTLYTHWKIVHYLLCIGALTAYISRSAPPEVKWDRYIITISSGQWHPKEGSSISGVICRECRFPPTAEIAECPERLKFVLVGGPGAEGSKKRASLTTTK